MSAVAAPIQHHRSIKCLSLQNADLWSLAKAPRLCSHRRVLIAYWTSAFWLGTAVLSASPLTVEHKRALG
jgi:hypothetical protein